MTLRTTGTYTRQEASERHYPNLWDVVALVLVLGVIILLAWGIKGMTLPYQTGESIPISLSPSQLPYYALRSVLRMLIALVFSLLFTFVFGTWAAKNRHAERIIIPGIDILQSVPILGFLTVAVVAFIAIFRGSLLGPEFAAIFAIFTSQVWNMALSFYQSLRTVPSEIKEAAQMFHLSPWRKFWRIEVPFAMPGLLWNMMLSMSASWFFVVASEAISVAGHNIMLPGIGSYIALAVNKADIHAVIYAIVAMLIVILLYDQLLFRPLIYWVERFQAEEGEETGISRSWLVMLFQRTRHLANLQQVFGVGFDRFVNMPWLNPRYEITRAAPVRRPYHHWLTVLWYTVLIIALLIAAFILLGFLITNTGFHEIEHVIVLGFYTGLRVMILIFLSSLIWVPVGVNIGLRPKLAAVAQPIVQFLAAFPANLLFPIVVLAIVKYHLNVNIWTAPLMVLGTQWYILFNVIAGTMAVAKETRQAVRSFHVKGWLWWRRFMLPAIFPFYVTGAITAAGGAWNASIIAEAVSWGRTNLEATGLGAYITHVSDTGEFAKLALGITVMSLYVLVINHLLWRPLYRLAEKRFSVD